MKVVILCGGKGTRIREESGHRPKSMIEIGGKPILWHIMKMYSHFGFNEFVLCLGYRQESIKEYFLNYELMQNDFTVELASREKIVHHKRHGENWRVTLVDTGLETKKGGRLKRVAPYLDGSRFMLTYGDGVGNIDIPKLIAFHEKSSKLATFTGVHPISRFATVETDENMEICNWEEKKTLEGYMNAGYFVLEKRVLDYIQDDCELEEEPMKQLAKERQVAMYRHENFWHCMDTYRDYMLLNGLWEKGEAAWKIWKDGDSK